MSKKKILLAEDNETFLKLLIFDLKGQGYEVLGLTKGDEVMETFGNFVPDLVILDGLLPGKDGFEIAKELRAEPKGKDIPIILLTGVYKETEFYKYSKEIGIDLHYDKSNFNGKEFLAEVKKLLAD